MTVIDSGKIDIKVDMNNKVNTNENHSHSVQFDSSKKKVGRPRHQKNQTTQNEVYKLSIVGTRYEDIALVLGISNDTLKKYYKDELQKGRIEANAAVAGTLYEKAKQGDTPSMIFWLKTRGQWSEKNTTELTGEGGAPINIKVVTGID
tara:strand:+ start:278 stop:721 length:444 start_codon:yes stop_codon:yes gene_type:complete